MPKLWSETIEAHRRDVRAAVLDTTAALVSSEGLLSVTMSRIAEESGIGRATLYKYFADVEAILAAWHERQVDAHLRRLAEAVERTDDPGERLEAVLTAFASAQHQMKEVHATDLAAQMHHGPHMARAHDHLRRLLRDVVAGAAPAGRCRDDIPPEELAAYCLHSLTAARHLPTRAAVDRLVQVTLAGLRPPSGPTNGAPS